QLPGSESSRKPASRRATSRRRAPSQCSWSVMATGSLRGMTTTSRSGAFDGSAGSGAPWGMASKQIPLVDYLVLDDGDPHLIAHECTGCGARFFDRRNACAGCFGTDFTTKPVATTG